MQFERTLLNADQIPSVLSWLINIAVIKTTTKGKCGHDVSAESRPNINSAGKFHGRDCGVMGGAQCSAVQCSGEETRKQNGEREKNTPFFLVECQGLV